jgi:hypothetical protein
VVKIQSRVEDKGSKIQKKEKEKAWYSLKNKGADKGNAN